MALDDQKRQQLNDVIHKATLNGEDDLAIQEIVSQFKAKYDTGQSQVAPTTQPNTQLEQPQGKSVAGFVSNVGSSGVDLLKNIFNAIKHPVTTAKTVAEIPIGAGAKIRKKYEEKKAGKSLAYTSEPEQVWDSVVQMIKDRYGSTEKLKETAYKDPVGVLADVAAVVSMGAGAVGKVGEVSKVSQLSKAGQVGSKVASAIDPLQATIKGATKAQGAINKAAGSAAAEALGTTTGVGADIIKTAYSKPEAVAEAMRGKITPEKIVESAKSALGKVKNKRSAEYQSKLSELRSADKSANIKFDNIKSSVDKALDNFDVKRKDGKLDFGNSALEGQGQRTMREVVDTIDNWKDTSVKGIDNLKKRIGEIYSPTNQARSAVESVRSTISQELDSVPGYKEMTAKYAEASDLLKELKSGLSLSDRASVQTTLTKLNTALKKSDFRKELVDELNKSTNKDLIAQIAGGQLNQLSPRGLTGSLIKILGLGGAAFPGTREAALAAIATSSPRVVGETVSAAGKASKIIRKATVPTAKAVQKAASNPAVNTLLRMLGITQNKKSDKSK